MPRSTGPGWLLVCSDGLWNYASEAPPCRRWSHADRRHGGTDPLAAGRVAWCDWANDQGGKDNITVALARH